MNQTITPPLRNISIDLIKALAMTLVMILHSISPIYNNLPCYLLGTISGIAIPLFFMVSGFLLINKKGGWKYSTHKIIGIIKFVSILALPIAIAKRLFLPINWLDPIEWAKDFIGPYLQAHAILWVLWYLGAMCIIYLILPFIQSMYRRYGLISLILSTMLFAVICNVCFTLNITVQFERGTYQTLRVYNWIYYFLLGANLNVLMPRIKEAFSSASEKQLPWILAPIVFALLYSCFQRYVTHGHAGGVEYHFGSAMCMAYSLVTFICIFFYTPGKFISKYVKILSNLFLPAFVIHVFVIMILSKIMPNTMFGDYTQLIKFPIVWIVTISISYIIMKTSIGRWVFRI